jgi:DNA-binding NtrC family response regulator
VAGEIDRTLTIEAPRAIGAVTSEPHLFLALESARPTAGGARAALAGVSAVEIGRGATRAIERTRTGARSSLRLTIPDSWMSSAHARIVRTPSGWMLEDAGSKNGVLVDGRRVDRAYLGDGALIELGRSFLILRTGLPTPSESPTEKESAANDLRGFSSLVPALAAIYDEATRMAATTQSIAVLGPTGSGKELCARAIHRRSGRSGDLVAVNCGALVDSVLESELFGHAAGAFSGAERDRPGLLAASSGGTLFLDEVGELTSKAQAALLRALQEREVRPVGTAATTPVDLRVISATHRPLAELCAADRFRDDLMARLAAFALELPPLAARREDLGHILRSLVDDGVELESAAARALFAYDWPRNVRELDACLVQALTLGDGAVVELAHCPPAVAGATLAVPTADVPPLDPADLMRRDQLRELLVRHRGNVSAVAREIGALRQTVQKWLQRYRIDAAQFRD